jgi:protein-S-isoprenylcysteine O-methyltransferase Ste14
MSAMEVTSYLVLFVYMVSFVGLTAAKVKLSNERPWFLGTHEGVSPALGRIYIACMSLAAIVPLARAWVGDPFPSDPVRLVLDGLTTDIIGHALMGVGACIGMVSQMHTSDLWRMGTNERVPGDLVMDGPFAVSRNPVFLGQILLFAGLFLVLPGTPQGLLTILLIAVILIRVRVEEDWLLGKYGERYANYSQRVRRWIGRRAGPA